FALAKPERIARERGAQPAAQVSRPFPIHLAFEATRLLIETAILVAEHVGRAYRHRQRKLFETAFDSSNPRVEAGDCEQEYIDSIRPRGLLHPTLRQLLESRRRRPTGPNEIIENEHRPDLLRSTERTPNLSWVDGVILVDQVLISIGLEQMPGSTASSLE